MNFDNRVRSSANSIDFTGVLAVPPAAACRPQRFCYLDASNIHIGGAQLSAARLGLAASANDAAQRGLIDHQYRISFPRLRELCIGPDFDSAARTVAVGSNLANSDGRVWQAVEHAGWLPLVLERAPSRREKGVDVTLAITMVHDLLVSGATPANADVTLVAGDRDYLRAVEMLKGHGFHVDVLAWEHSLSRELALAARKVVLLDQHFAMLRYHPARR
jgi:hypothetical protein